METVNFCGFLAGALLGTVIFSPPFLKLIDTFNISLYDRSALDYSGKPTFFLIIEAWFLFAILYWVAVQTLESVTTFLFPFLIFLFSSVFYFSFLSYPVALLLWLLTGFAVWILL